MSRDGTSTPRFRHSDIAFRVVLAIDKSSLSIAMDMAAEIGDFGPPEARPRRRPGF